MKRPRLIRLGVAIGVAFLAIVAGVVATDSTSAPPRGDQTRAEANQGDGLRERPARSDERHGEDATNTRHRNEPPRMPSLIGLSAAKAIDVVDGLGRRINWGGGACRDRQPLGRVIDHYPKPGGRLFPNGNAIQVSFDRVWVCSRRTAQSACAHKDLKFEMFARHDFGDGEPVGDMLVGVHVKNRGRSPCQLTATAKIELHRPDDPSAFVLGSPRGVDFDFRLNPGDEILGGAWWTNWCGSRSGKWRVDADVGDYHGEAHLQEPDCQRRHEDSLLY